MILRDAIYELGRAFPLVSGVSRNQLGCLIVAVTEVRPLPG